jgi:methionyl-tRNA synthetase
VQHLIGKDILKPHAVYWPCMLKAAGIPLYRHLNVHGYWRIGGGKMSKSVGNVVEALALADTYGNDAFRYFIMREMVFGLDADFSEEAFVARLNADLANDLGNLASRASTLIVNFAGGVIPAAGAPTGEDRAVAAAFARARKDAEAAMEEFGFHRALAAIWEFIAVVNRYVDASAPWELRKDPAKQPRLDAVLYTLGESLRALGIVLAPFLPDAAAKIRAGLGQSTEPALADAVWGRLSPGTRVTKIAALFPRVEEKKPAAAPAADGAAQISIEEFQKIDLRVAQVLAAEAVPKSKKLLKLRVSLGSEERTVLAGIAEHYAPADLVGKKVVVVANLKAAKLMGLESQGMVLAGEGAHGLGVVMPDRDLPPGSKVK